MKIGKIFGIELELHWTWFIFFGFLIWIFSDYFAETVPGNSAFSYFAFGVLTASLLFFSVLFHEFAHSLVGRNIFGIPFRKITLFIFGGAARFGDEENPEGFQLPSAKAEFWTSVAGPLSSFALAGIFWALLFLFIDDPEISSVSAMVTYLFLINIVLGVFNLLPGFPMDGGRIFRSLIWWKSKNLLKATKIAYRTGMVMFFLLPVSALFWGGIFSVLWISFIVFRIIIPAAGAEYESVAKRPLKEVKIISGIALFIVHLPFIILEGLIKIIKKIAVLIFRKNKSQQ